MKLRRNKQVLDLQAIDLLGPVPLELLEGFQHREAGELDAALDAALLTPMGLAFNEP